MIVQYIHELRKGLAGAGFPGRRSLSASPPPIATPGSHLPERSATSMAHPTQHWQWMTQQQQSRSQPPHHLQYWQQVTTTSACFPQTKMPIMTPTRSMPPAEHQQAPQQADTHPTLPWFRKKNTSQQQLPPSASPRAAPPLNPSSPLPPLPLPMLSRTSP